MIILLVVALPKNKKQCTSVLLTSPAGICAVRRDEIIQPGLWDGVDCRAGICPVPDCELHWFVSLCSSSVCCQRHLSLWQKHAGPTWEVNLGIVLGLASLVPPQEIVPVAVSTQTLCLSLGFLGAPWRFGLCHRLSQEVLQHVPSCLLCFWELCTVPGPGWWRSLGSGVTGLVADRPLVSQQGQKIHVKK